MAPLVQKIFARRRRKQCNRFSSMDRASIPTFLRRYGYLAFGPHTWHPSQKDSTLSIRITNHAEVDSHTRYHVECSITWPGDDGSHVVHTWAVEQRLMNFRVDLHDPVKRELASSYKLIFGRAHFARRGGPRGTSARLNRWLQRLAHCINSREVPPVVVALTLVALNAPDAPSVLVALNAPEMESGICDSQLATLMSTSASKSEATSIVLARNGPRHCSIPMTASVSHMASQSETEESCSDGWSDLALSDADTLELAGTSEETCADGVICNSWLETLEDSNSRLPIVDPGKHFRTADCPSLQIAEERGDHPDESELQAHSQHGAGTFVDSYPLEAHLRLGLNLKPAAAAAGEVVSQVKPESKLEAKMRARREIVDLQKISGRGMLF